MKNFEQHIYKNPDWQIGGKKEFTLEQCEYSEKIADEKLKKILEPGFRDFAVRYMNIEEYRTLVETGKLSGEFTVCDKSLRQGSDFSKFLESFADGYDTKNAMSITQWEEISGLASVKTMDLINSIKSIRADYLGKKEEERDSEIRKFLLNYIDSGIPYHRTKNTDRYNNAYSRLMTPSGISDLNPDLKKLDENDENFLIIQSFREDEKFLSQKDSLRKLLVALSAVYDDTTEHQHRQYHVALIVDSSIMDKASNSWGVEYWKELYESQTEKIDKKEKYLNILGVISVYPLKEMYKEIIEIEKGAEELAHPVFDHNGVVRFPKTDSQA